MSMFVVGIASCNCVCELSIVFLLYATSLVLDVWLGETVRIIAQAVMWMGVLVWFSLDRQNRADVVDSVELETIELE